MSKTLYYALQISEQHAGRNSYDPTVYVSLGNGVVAPGRPEWQDVGTANYNDVFNYNALPDEVWAHFTVDREAFDKPSDYGSTLTYDTFYFGNHSTQTYPKWASILVPDDFSISPGLDKGDLAVGWSGNSLIQSAISGDFSWSGAASAIYNTIALSAAQVRDAVSAGLQLGFSQVVSWATGQLVSSLGVSSLWNAIKRDSAVQTSLTKFVNGGTDTLTALMNGFRSGMTPQQADALVQKFMNTTAFDFHQTAESVIFSGIGGAELKAIVKGVRLAERWAVDPNTGAITHSQAITESDGSYNAQGGRFLGQPAYGNDVVLDGDGSSSIDTQESESFIPAGQRDIVGAGGGNDYVTTGDGDDVIDGGEGLDRLVPAAGNDWVDGGTGLDTVFYSGSSSSYSITRIGARTYQITDLRPGSPNGSDTLVNTERLEFQDGTSIKLGPAFQNDFNQDGGNDLLLQDGAGNLVAWLMQGGRLVGGKPIENPSRYGYATVHETLGMRGAATGDFNGDGTADLLIQDSQGNLAAWLMRDGNLAGGSHIGNPSQFSYRFVATGDFNGDGTTDILLSDTLGDLALLTMQGGNVVDTRRLGNPSLYGFQLVAVGDFNDDGTSDILLQDRSGNLVDWTMQNGRILEGHSIGNFSIYGFGLVGAGDFTGDGTTDLLLQDKAGNLAEWRMGYGAVIGSNYVGTPATYGAVLAGLGDFDANGTSDLLLNDLKGNLVSWSIQNGRVNSGQSINNPGSFGFHLA